jgi:hypothetical protein
VVAVYAEDVHHKFNGTTLDNHPEMVTSPDHNKLFQFTVFILVQDTRVACLLPRSVVKFVTADCGISLSVLLLPLIVLFVSVAVALFFVASLVLSTLFNASIVFVVLALLNATSPLPDLLSIVSFHADMFHTSPLPLHALPTTLLAVPVSKLANGNLQVT